MPNNTVRTIIIFGVIAVVLSGAAVGGIMLLKARNNTHAAQTQTVNAPTAPQGEQKPADNKPEPQNANNQDPKKNDTPASSKPEESSAPSNSKSTAQDPGVVPDGTLPATGASEDFLATAVLMMLAIFFGVKLLKTRAAYRRHLQA